MGCVNSKPKEQASAGLLQADDYKACVDAHQAAGGPGIKASAVELQIDGSKQPAAAPLNQPAGATSVQRAEARATSATPDSVPNGSQRSAQAAAEPSSSCPAEASVAGTAREPAVDNSQAAPSAGIAPGPALVDGAAAAATSAAAGLLAAPAAAEPPPAAPQASAPPPAVADVADIASPRSDSAAAPVASGPPYSTGNAAPQQSALANSSKASSGIPPRSVKFAEPPPSSSSSLQGGPSRRSAPGAVGRPRGSLPRRSQSGLIQASGHVIGEQLNAAVLAKQAEILRSNKMGKLRQRRGGLDSSFAAMQEALATDEKPLAHVNTRAAGLKHIGFGPFKRENQDEFFIQVGEFGGQHSSNLFCVFDGHGTYGKDAALYSRQLLPRLLDVELNKYFQRVNCDSDEGLKGAVEVLITEVFGETERSLAKFGVNLASSGTTASVAYQKGNRLWVASAGDSRAIMCSRNVGDQWRALPLTIDHRPRRESERERIEAAGARVAPKRLPSGRTVGEPRLWLHNAHGPGLLLSRSLGDLTAATVGCTSDPEVSYTTLRPGVDHVLVMATDGVWDVLTNEQVCDIVVESPDPHIACRRVLDAALYEWEERMSADNITVLVVEFDWGEEGSINSVASMEAAAVARNEEAGLSDVDASVIAVPSAGS